MADDQGEKTEEPTEHKLEEARKKGQVFKSTEMIGALSFASMAVAIALTGPLAVNRLRLFTTGIYQTIPHLSFTNQDVRTLILNTVFTFAKVLLPLLAVAFVAGLLLNVAQTGVIFSAQPLTPTFQKISPIEGFKRMFSRKSVVEMLKQIFKVSVIAWISYKIIRGSMDQISAMVMWNVKTSALFIKNLLFKIIWYVLGAYLIMAIADYLIQRKLFMMQMRMSVQELKDEFKDTEGDPHVKARMRQMQRQLVERNMMKQVPNATAVITNPVHLAVALEYKDKEMEAPIVTAKGERMVAQTIKAIAEEHEIPVIENIGLARALFESCKVGQEIPGELYKAVAEILAFVFRLRRKRMMSKKRAILKVRGKRK